MQLLVLIMLFVWRKFTEWILTVQLRLHSFTISGTIHGIVMDNGIMIFTKKTISMQSKGQNAPINY
jgi:hypothetical protein